MVWQLAVALFTLLNTVLLVLVIILILIYN